MITERDNLELHVDLCTERYKRLEEKFEQLEDRLDELHDGFLDFKVETNKNLSDIKNLISAGQSEKFKVMVATTGTIIVALLGTLGFLIMHLK